MEEQSGRFSKQRLDPATMGWNSLYPDSKIRHVMLEGSDHAMLFLTTEKVWLRKGRRFMYDARWSKMQDCRDLVNED
ncbi:hypothetical protein ACFX15_031775 [Malus domestica]